MTIQRKIANWRRVGRFCTRRLVDYGELIPIELAETKKRVLHEMVALVALTIGALFTLSFVSIAVIVTAASTPYLVLTAWCVAGTWFAVAVIAVIVIMSRKPAQPFQTLRQELQRDMDAIKEVAQ
ncbi:phage holin family protein [Caballeronia novacaledonica]|uniref:Phage holin family protein n=1 Tax=Caballeronia novacaledonica TaxID=1544861 RepID=A0ACB5QSD8_9BURK|nr:phage holin family protein [Caballeronia novacaledonica]